MEMATINMIYPKEFSRIASQGSIHAETTSLPVLDGGLSDSLVQAESTSTCFIDEHLAIPRSGSGANAIVIRSFSLQLIRSEEGYVAASSLCNICEEGATKGEAAGRYLYSLVDELIWLQNRADNLSKPLSDELDRIKSYIRIV